MTKPMNTEAIEKGTGKPWEEWRQYLDSINAADLSHKEIAQKVYEAGSPGWWAQTITVAYEQYIGRRIPGQDNKGEFSVSVTKTVDGTMDQALKAWTDLVVTYDDFSGVPISRAGETSKTDKWRYWRCGLGDGSAVVVTVYQKTPEKASLSVTSEKLKSSDDVEHWRQYWKNLLAGL